MDEPTSSLDEHEVEVLFDVIRQLKRRRRLGDLRQPQARRALRRLRPRHHHARRPHRRDGPMADDRQARARRRHARARPADGAPRAGRRASMAAAMPATASCSRPRACARACKVKDGQRRGPRRRDRRPRRAARLRPDRSWRAPSSAPTGPRRARSRVDGKRVVLPASPSTPSRAGIGFCSEDRKVEGIVPDMSVRENLTLALLPQLAAVRRRRRGQAARDRRPLHQPARASRCAGPEQKIRELSGGNQQKVLLARWLCMNPQAPDPRRADPRHRCRRQGRDPGADPRARRAGARRPDDLLRARGGRRGRRARLRAARRPHRRRAAARRADRDGGDDRDGAG